jgi:flagellar hook-associated protein 3 FlgL
MRITANMTAENSLYNIQQGRTKLDTLQEVISSGQNVNRPSDDPISTRLLMDIGDKLKAIDQYSANISKANSWLKFTSTSLSGVSSVITEGRKIAAQLNTGSSDPTTRQSAHDLLVDLKKQVLDMANTPYGDQYIFAGTNNAVPPFVERSGDLAIGSSTVSNVNVTGVTAGMPVSGPGIPAGSFIGPVLANSFTLVDSLGAAVVATAATTGSALNIYRGNSTQFSVEITQSSTQVINVTGDRLFNGTGSNPSYGSIDIFKAFDDMIEAVGTSLIPSDVAAISLASQKLQDGTKQFNIVTSDIISRTTRLDNMNTLNANTKNTMLSISTGIQEVDYAKMGVLLNNQKLAFDASLSATAKLSQLSLLDYM